MFGVAGLGTTLFLGGWSAPLSFLGVIPSWIWFFLKVELWICFFIWLRGTLPRLRQDQLMNFAWKFCLPVTLINIFVTALWRFLGDGWARWVACTLILAVVYAVMGRVGMARGKVAPRSYRYAE
jgi:NADH-quinone oxidoreductase subunit H